MITITIALKQANKIKALPVTMKNWEKRHTDCEFKTGGILFDELGGNYTIATEPTQEQIKEIALRCYELYETPFNKYELWYSKPIKMWRLVFGN